MAILTYDGTSHLIEKIVNLLKGKSNTDHKHTKSDITDFPTLGTASSKDVASTGNASSGQVVMGNDTRLTDARKASDVSSWAKASTKPTYTASEVGAYTKEETDTKLSGKANSSHTHGNVDITSLDASKITSGTISIDRLPQGALERLTIVADDTARFKLTSATVQKGDTVKVTATGRMYYVVDDTKLSSEAGYEVYAAGTAASVPWSGVTGKPSSYTPSSHNHDDRYYTESEMDTKLAGKVDLSRDGINEAINKLDVGASVPTDADYYLSQYVGGGTTTTTYHRRPVSALWNYIKGKADKVYSALGHKHTKSEITDFPSSMPASDVYPWAKAKTKPSYTKSEVGLGNVDNTADVNKSVKYATSAGSAGSVAWSNVSGKPSTFTPSSHSHNYNDLSNKPALGSAASKTVRTLSAVGASGWKDLGTDQGYVPDMAFMAYWNGAYSGSVSNLAYCNKGAFGTAATSDQRDFATVGHTHSNYLTGINKSMIVNALGYTPPTTDTNTWRPVQNNLTSTSITDCLSAAQGKILKDMIDNNSGSGKANYESGTWSPEIGYQGESSYYYLYDGKYEKIGDLVFLTCCAGHFKAEGKDTVYISKSSIPFPMVDFMFGRMNHAYNNDCLINYADSINSFSSNAQGSFSASMPVPYVISIIYRTK